MAQSTISGDITGIVTDPTGAVLPNAPVSLKNNSTGATSSTNTNGAGVYRFSLLAPGSYTVTVTPQGFQEVKRSVNVTVGQASTLNLQAAISGGGQTVEVTAEGGVLQTQNADVSTTFTSAQISQLPNPGNDLSYIVQSAPGAVMNTQAGYGNSAIFGLPATSNLFTVDGQNENDPFLNLNNSGATNLLLGQNDIQEATVVNNGYSGQYGGLAGANVNYVTKSGSNKFHGNATYYWNGRIMNANNYFNNQNATPRPFDNANQWAASIGGPIRKNKTFFFLDTEGLRVVLPTNTPVNVPTAQFETATLTNLLTAKDPNTGASLAGEIPFYQQAFSLWNSAPGAQRAGPIPGDTTGGCSGFTGPGGLGTTVPCALQFRSTAGNFTHEWLLTARVDQNISNNDRLFIHFRTDHGVQATYTDPINPIFNAVSDQPQYEGQLNETHTIGPRTVNQFIVTGSWYSALFNNPNHAAALATFPFRLGFSGRAFFALGNDLNFWPQGRNVTQYQIVDDLSHTHGSHNLKFGVNFRRNDVTDYSPGLGSVGYSSSEDLGSFFNGVGATYIQNFPTRPTAPIALYGLGLYAQDEWGVTKNLKLTLSLRAEHNSNPVCQINCFARFTNSFEDIPHDPNQPYNQVIQTGLHQALRNYTNIDWQPRFGFAWTPLGLNGKTVVRGGFGLFGDAFPATIADSFLNNSPLNNQFTAGVAPLSPTTPGSQPALVSAANTAFTNGFFSGGTAASIAGTLPTGVPFVPPNFYNARSTIHAPRYEQWNLEVQQGLGDKSSLSLNYVGNHGLYEAVQNAGLNAFCDITCLGTLGAPATATSFVGLPAAPADSRFGTITQVGSDGVSNYNGLVASFTRRFSSVQLQANYTWSHALDEISNAGFLQYNFLTNESTLNPQNPFNLRQNYGNADYDTRQQFNFNYVWNTPNLRGFIGLIADWTISGTVFYRTGLPYTAVDSTTTGVLNSFNYGTTAGFNVFANTTIGGATCDRSAVTTACVESTINTPGGQYSPALTGFGNQRRNQLFGPNFFDTDLTVMKNFKFPHWESGNLGLGLQFFNLFNHANFDQPVGDIFDPQFGRSNTTVSVPTSIVGSFLGGDASPRMIQIKGTLTF
ncbi:MAG TPA: carboxypeptidase regulatory-like domain-containing protein [Terriglobales bacterium]|nr:carboxypeptidase regulatory-like domain-containing protein [Terriglobales bacterium]